MRSARAANHARIAYSVKWPSFRSAKWMAASVASLACGNSKCSGRMMKLEVCEDDSKSLEPTKINVAQIIGGP